MQVAIVGRPNVGKSSLLNRLAGRRISIVDQTPGVTRDRVTVALSVEPPLETPKGTPAHAIEVIDTGGYGIYTAEGKQFDDVGEDLSSLTDPIEAQIRTAIKQAQFILFVIDAQQGITALDETVARLLRRSGAAERVCVIANKVDGESWEAFAADASRLGMGEPLCVSAVNGFRMRQLHDRLWEAAESHQNNNSAEADLAPSQKSPEQPEFTFAIVGKRNAGKSTLLNALAGETRAIVSEIAGTTRDAIDVRFDFEGHSMVAIDTAGLRRRHSIADDVEYYAFRRAVDAISRADVCVFLIDATLPISSVDKKLSAELRKQFKPTVIAVNKWDMVPDDKASLEEYAEYLSGELRGIEYAPIVIISAKEREGLHDLIAMTHNLYQQASHRESTGRLNRLIQDILAMRGPSSRLGTQAKVYYVSQVSTNPPTIVFIVNRPDLFTGAYERYLQNRLHEELDFSEVPIRLLFRPRGPGAAGDEAAAE